MTRKTKPKRLIAAGPKKFHDELLGGELKQLRAENESLRYILGRILVQVALKLKSQGEYIEF